MMLNAELAGSIKLTFAELSGKYDITIFSLDNVMQGPGYDKTLFVFSEYHELIKKKLVDDLGRGGTYTDG